MMLGGRSGRVTVERSGVGVATLDVSVDTRVSAGVGKAGSESGDEVVGTWARAAEANPSVKAITHPILRGRLTAGQWMEGR
jgi:hypothetical protein